MRPMAEFNALDAPAAAEKLLACCAVPEWAEAVASQRPYAAPDDLSAAAAAAFDALDPAQIRQAVAAHPALGSRPAGESTEANWSRSEQRTVLAAEDQVLRDMAAANRAYRDRFGQVFLCRAAGRSAAELLAEARRRLGNDPATEALETAGELRAIVLLRVDRLVHL